MQSLKQHIKLNKFCLLIACIHWIISFFTDRLIFEYVTWDFSNLIQSAKTIITCGCKVVFLLLLIGLWHGIFLFVKKADRSFVKYTLIYMGINLVLLVLTWPGIWRMDEFGLLSNALRLQPVFWQNYLTSIFYIFSVMLFPCPSGVILCQIVVNSLITGYILWQLERSFAEQGKPAGRWIYLGYLPFIMLPVLDSNLYPMRMSVYAFLELLLIFLLYRQRKSEYKNGFVWALALLGGVVTVWRTEAIYYIVAIPVLILVLFWSVWEKGQKMKAIICYLVVTIVLFVPQQLGNQLTSGNEYDLTSVVLPLVPLVEEANRHEDSAELLEEIDQVINVEVALCGAREGKSGISLYWSRPDEFKRDYTSEEYRSFKSAYYKLIIKYPAVFLKERWQSFIGSTGLLENTTELFTKEGVPNYDSFRKYFLGEPISDKLRTNVIEKLEWRKTGAYETTKSGYGWIYSAIPAIILLAICCIACLIRKKWNLALLLATPLAKVPLIFVTAPSRLFMYYYSVYLIGYGVIVFVLIRWLHGRVSNG